MGLGRGGQGRERSKSSLSRSARGEAAPLTLNPIERVWLYLKERFLSHRLHADYDAIADAAPKAWNRLIAETGRLTSLCSYPWIPEVK